MKKLVAFALPVLLMIAFVPSAEANPATSKVTINSVPSLYGYVNSSKPARCAAHRGVSVFRKKAGKDALIADTRTKKNGGGWQWSIYGRPKGKVYAKAVPKAGCKPGQSKTVKVTPVSDTPAPPCPSLALGICSIGNSINTALRLGSSSGCPNYQAPSASCDGAVVGGPPAWRPNASGNVHWNGASRESLRGFAYYNGDSFLEGSTNGFRDESFPIRDARATTNGPHFCTPNLPGKAAGDRGGPLKLVFRRTGNVSYFSMYGFMVKKDDDKGC